LEPRVKKMAAVPFNKVDVSAFLLVDLLLCFLRPPVEARGGGGVLCRSSSTEDGGFVCCLSGLLAFSGKLTTRGLMPASLPCPCIPWPKGGLKGFVA
jgi:hypothetical protein